MFWVSLCVLLNSKIKMNLVTPLPVTSPGRPRWLSGKESDCQCRRREFSSWSGKIPWRRAWQPTPVLLPGESHGQRSLAGYSPWGRKESETAEQLHMSTPGNLWHPGVLEFVFISNGNEFWFSYTKTGLTGRTSGTLSRMSGGSSEGWPRGDPAELAYRNGLVWVLLWPPSHSITYSGDKTLEDGSEGLRPRHVSIWLPGDSRRVCPFRSEKGRRAICWGNVTQ